MDILRREANLLVYVLSFSAFNQKINHFAKICFRLLREVLKLRYKAKRMVKLRSFYLNWFSFNNI